MAAGKAIPPDSAAHLIFTRLPAYIFCVPMSNARRNLRNRESLLRRSPRRRSPAAKGSGGEHGSRKNPGHERRFYLPGEPIRMTGIYEVLHDRDHRAAHEVVMHAGDLFPECDTCQQQVRFRLVRTAPYIFEDTDFAPEQ